MVDVVAALIRDGERFLICKRPAHKARALMWEFPGGKVEPGEAPEAALARELREELEIEAEVGGQIACVEADSPGKRVRLDVREVRFRGKPRGAEGQALAWVPLHKLPDYPMPPADLPVVEILLGAAAD